MTIWFLLWLVLSAALLYFLGWTLFILYRQKKAWQKYAAVKKLRYTSARPLASPEMSGVLHDYSVSFFTGEHQTPDLRGTRKLTAIEINLSSRMPFEGSLGSGGMVPLVRTLGLKEEVLPSHANWDKSWIAQTGSRGGLEAYLTPERLEALITLMKTPNAWIIFLFRGDVMLLRLDTPDPLDTPQKIDRVVKVMTDTARALELKAGEDVRLKTAMTQAPRKTAAAKPAKPAANLELEVEEAPPPPAVEEPPQEEQ